MNNQKINAAYGEALLRLAVIENHKRELNAIPPRKALEQIYSFSPEHEIRMKKLFAKRQRKSISKAALFRRVAAAVIITLAVSFGALLTNAGVRAAVWETVVEWYSEFTRFTFHSSDSVDESIQWYPSYLPEGFVEVGYETIGTITYIDFIDSSGNCHPSRFDRHKSIRYNRMGRGNAQCQ